MSQEIKREAVREAIMALGLIVPEAEDHMSLLLRDQMDISPRQIATEYRKQGEQISKEKKKELGIRANGFLSCQACIELTNEGRSVPLQAHETVLMRATFTFNRYRTLQSLKNDEIRKMKGFLGIKYDVYNINCPACGPLDGKLIQVDDASIFPPQGCTCHTANFIYVPSVDFLAGWNDEE